MRKSSASKVLSAVETPKDSRPLEAIGRALRAHYDDLLGEPLPARFEELLARLEAGEAEPDAAKPRPKTE